MGSKTKKPLVKTRGYILAGGDAGHLTIMLTCLYIYIFSNLAFYVTPIVTPLISIFINFRNHIICQPESKSYKREKLYREQPDYDFFL